MNITDLPPIVIVLLALLAAGALCVLVAGVMHCCAKPEPEPDFGFKIPQEREFTDPLDGPLKVGSVPARQGPPRGPSGEIEIICGHCHERASFLRVLPNGQTACAICHEKLVLEAAPFTRFDANGRYQPRRF